MELGGDGGGKRWWQREAEAKKVIKAKSLPSQKEMGLPTSEK